MNDLTNAHAEEPVVLRQPTAGYYLQIQSVVAKKGEPQSITLHWQTSAQAATVMPAAAARNVSSVYILISGDYDITMEPAGGEE